MLSSAPQNDEHVPGNAWDRCVAGYASNWSGAKTELCHVDREHFGKWLDRRPLIVSETRKHLLLALGESVSQPLAASATVPCLLWTGPKRVRVRCQSRAAARTKHFRRLVYESARGPVPEGWVCVALCEGGGVLGEGKENMCVEPRHLTTRPRPPPGVTAMDDAIGDAAEHAVALLRLRAHKECAGDTGVKGGAGLVQKRKREEETIVSAEEKTEH